MRLLVALFSVLLISGCAGSGNDVDGPDTAGQVDLKRYQGAWYEQARLPMFFQRNCVRSEANYRLQNDGRMAVTNRCETTDGEWKQAQGEAFPQQEGRTDKLWVRFDNWFSKLFPGLTKGHYWILYLADDYSVALVGSPDRDNLWLLSRDKEIDAATRDRLLDEARKRGYDTSELIWRGESS
ncbi:lipocalin family protein [Stutzerimonas xanthomarina]|uniref:Outer membrane lipoprotein Blc n=2 Tax=Stutzerimonas xanthomarina TaxID=271420 RepID=A0A1M5TP49_9GAMM|nr:lipocalin family protein [Stutzerimonas xanthomarina]MCP9340034.1 lipocalin family protein [Stutzerimonas xanthomarina]SEH56580.1 apolipoprotein D and lipocalin family protein [Stutzerimonas xanthomarina]SHH52416.1 apolipoprotein D and lipocalin family protein [Stutzerimonas xanthomarina DSM 18231]